MKVVSDAESTTIKNKCAAGEKTLLILVSFGGVCIAGNFLIGLTFGY